MVAAALTLVAPAATVARPTQPSMPPTPGPVSSDPALSSESASSALPAFVPVEEVDGPLEEFGGLLDDEGVLGLDAALAVFAATVAPLSGIEPAAFTAGPPDGAAAAAIRRLAGADDELSGELMAAIDSALAVLPGEVEVVVGEPVGERSTGWGSAGRQQVSRPRPSPSSRPLGIPEPTADELAVSVAAIVDELQFRSGHTLSIPIRARLVPTARFGGDATAVASRRDGRTNECRITIPRGLFGPAGADGDSTNSTIVHEIWHCFQYDVDYAATARRQALWVIEGQAEWVGETLVGGSPSSSARWDSWLSRPQRSLYSRSYDAIGVFAVAASSGADPWTTMLPMLGQGNQAAVETLFGRAAGDAVVVIGSALARAPAVGAEWESFGPGITTASAAPVLAIPEGEPATIERAVGRFASMPVVLAVTAGDVATVSLAGGVGGAVELPGAGPLSVASGETVLFCLRVEGCVCPDGTSPGGGPPLPMASPGEGAAAVGAVDADRLKITVVKRSLDELCSRTLVGTWAVPVNVVMATMTAPYGPFPMTCDGDLVLTFTADGSYGAGFVTTCSLEGLDALGQASFAAGYVSDEATFQLDNLSGSGTMAINGVATDMPMSFLPVGVPVLYKIDNGDVLTVSFSAPDGNNFTLSFTRRAGA